MSPCLRRAARALREEIGERHRGLVRRDRQAVDFRQRAERRVAGHEEIAEQPRIGRAGGGMSTKKRSSACAFSGGASR